MPATHYEVLSVPQHSDAATIDSAYRRLALLWHPDKSPPQHRQTVEAHFKRIVAAYECLGDSQQRRLYDATLVDENDASGSAASDRRQQQQESERQRQQQEREQQAAEARERDQRVSEWIERHYWAWPDRARHHPWTRALDTPFVRLRRDPRWIGCITGAYNSQDIRNCPIPLRVFGVEWIWSGDGPMPAPGLPWGDHQWKDFVAV